jgi:F-type H+-transporting ATPase subunit gamma
MATLKELKQKINSVKNTQKTTRAMKLVSTAKLKRAEEALLRSREYARKIDEVIKDISAKLAAVKDTVDLRAFAKVNTQKVDIIVITADKGLCGGFNIQTIKTTLNLIKELKEKKVKIRLKVIGKKAIEYFKFVGIEMNEEIVGLSSVPDYEKAKEIIEESYKDFVEENIDNIILIHNGYVNKLTQKVEIQNLLPIEVKKEESSDVYLEVEPDQDYEIILETLVKQYLEYSLYYALLDSLAAEHSARMQAMDAATNNAKEMVHQLTLQFNKVRQENVTRELIEIVTAIEAMKK